MKIEERMLEECNKDFRSFQYSKRAIIRKSDGKKFLITGADMVHLRVYMVPATFIGYCFRLLNEIVRWCIYPKMVFGLALLVYKEKRVGSISPYHKVSSWLLPFKWGYLEDYCLGKRQ